MQESEQEVVLSAGDTALTPIPLTAEELEMVGGGIEGTPHIE